MKSTLIVKKQYSSRIFRDIRFTRSDHTFLTAWKKKQLSLSKMKQTPFYISLGNIRKKIIQLSTSVTFTKFKNPWLPPSSPNSDMELFNLEFQAHITGLLKLILTSKLLNIYLYFDHFFIIVSLTLKFTETE